MCVIIDPPPPKAKSADEDVFAFYSRPDVLCIAACFILGSGAAMAIEWVIPVVANLVLGWGTTAVGGMLLVIAFTLFGSQLLVMVTKRWESLRYTMWSVDYNHAVFGSGGMALTLLIAVAAWSLVFPRGMQAVSVARQYPCLVMAPFVIVEVFFPWLANGVISTFTRLVERSVPSYMGISQAMVTVNGVLTGQLLITFWISKTYTEETIAVEGVPKSAFLAIHLAQLLVWLGTWANRGTLKESLNLRSSASAWRNSWSG